MLKYSSSTNWIFSLQKSTLKLIFAGSKNPVRNKLKIQFIELDFSKLIFQKSNTDQQGVIHNNYINHNYLITVGVLMIQKGMINGTYLVLHTTKSAFICKFSELSFSDTLKIYIHILFWVVILCDVCNKKMESRNHARS